MILDNNFMLYNGKVYVLTVFNIENSAVMESYIKGENKAHVLMSQKLITMTFVIRNDS